MTALWMSLLVADYGVKEESKATRYVTYSLIVSFCSDLLVAFQHKL